MAVAIAAPLYSRFNTYMKIGSKPTFNRAPAINANMAVLAAPSLDTILFIVTLKTLNMENVI